ncbi:hypothetical protein MMF94_18465 [Pseudonocardia alaniniphila]|uniref:Uncharacterized protein n=1 Tax=Pseudonocardia alaniniphila TaxID=75291 RepID=A0ABS9TGL5_9PSEU|nr:hypothetical protein [Pseudonocardia alaniniphila]MCH6167674.1 hypothetical protein [Pseudonocardia alaniniphila]
MTCSHIAMRLRSGTFGEVGAREDLNEHGSLAAVSAEILSCTTTSAIGKAHRSQS